jgi:hypothetical protein
VQIQPTINLYANSCESEFITTVSLPADEGATADSKQYNHQCIRAILHSDEKGTKHSTNGAKINGLVHALAHHQQAEGHVRVNVAI